MFDELARLLEESREDPLSSAAGGQDMMEVSIGDARYVVRREEHPRAGRLLLSPREREIVRLIASGLTNKAIAAVLEISQWTVATHVRRVYQKLDVGSRAAVVRAAIADGIVRSDDPRRGRPAR